jgi:RNA polymerase sigma-70 factor (ECF subfamily)
MELRAVVMRAVARLPERQRTVFTMRHVSGLSLEEIAVATNCATGTVKCHLSRATRRLREMLEPYLSEAHREV